MEADGTPVDDESRTIDQQLVRNSDQIHTLLHNYFNNLPQSHDAVTITKIIKSINEFEPKPTLLDSHLKRYISRLCQIFINEVTHTHSDLTRASGAIVYNLAKVRGFKVLTQYFDSDVYTVVTLLQLLEETQDGNELFLIQMWFCNLILVPFGFNRDITEKAYATILKLLTKHSNGSKNQIVSAMLLCNLLSRADLIQEGYLEKYLTMIFDDWSSLGSSEKLSHSMVVNKLMKRLPLYELTKYYERLFETMQLELLLIRTKDASNLSILYLIKVLSKLGRISLQQLNFAMLQQIITILIDMVHTYNESFETNLRYATAKALSGINTKLAIVAPNYQEQFFLFLLDLLELDLAGALSKFTDISVNFDTVSIAKFHTVLLFLGYTALGNSLPLHFVSVVLSIVHKTLFASQKRININIGSQLKDSSCFVIWAILKNMRKDQYELYQEAFRSILLDLIEVTVFDSDIVIRRCAIATLQELVGRFGYLTFEAHDHHIRGEKVVRFIELFTNSAVSAPETAVNILDGLLVVGIPKGLILSLLLKNLVSCRVFRLQTLYSSKIAYIMSSNYREDLSFGIESPAFDIEIIEQGYDSVDNSLYFKSELWAKLNKQFVSIDLAEATEEESLKYLEFCCLAGVDLNQWKDSLLMIVKSRRDISNSFNGFLSIASQTRTDVSWLVKEACHNLTPMLSKSLFSYHMLENETLEMLLKIMNTTRVDYEIRSNLLKGLNANFDELSVERRLTTNLISLLDDYTTTEQGDVGSKIRGTMLDIISGHLEFFRDCFHVLEPRLIRIAGESMEILRLKSLQLLLRLRDIKTIDTQPNNETLYSHLFQYYRRYIWGTEHSIEFLRGLAFSAGGLTGDISNLNYSFRALLAFVREDHKLSVVLQQLLSLITKRSSESQRVLKEYVVALNLINKLFEAGVTMPDRLLNAMFAKSYNLQINTNQASRIKLTVNLMKHLALTGDEALKLKSFKRLLWLLQNHKLEVIRRFALQAIYEVVLLEVPSMADQVENLDLQDKEALHQFEVYILDVWNT